MQLYSLNRTRFKKSNWHCTVTCACYTRFADGTTESYFENRRTRGKSREAMKWKEIYKKEKKTIQENVSLHIRNFHLARYIDIGKVAASDTLSSAHSNNFYFLLHESIICYKQQWWKIQLRWSPLELFISWWNWKCGWTSTWQRRAIKIFEKAYLRNVAERLKRREWISTKYRLAKCLCTEWSDHEAVVI
jgi:hypothetical protein